VLERLAATTLAAGRRLLGCRPEAVRVAGSKLATTRALAARGVPVVPTFSQADPPADVPGPWAVKPDDGAGCDGLELFPDRAAALARLTAAGGRLVAQPWIAGEALSLSLLCGRGAPLLLACNRQRLGRHDGHITLDAILVNDVADTDGQLARLARGVADAIPGLWGYVGVDLVQGAEGPLVLEVNPRLTTSYCGLRAALGCNTAALVVELARRGDLPITRLDRGVTAEVRVSHAA
jgi:predicted ATP-grasp superfamily ATP-dependent carboligase